MDEQSRDENESFNASEIEQLLIQNERLRQQLSATQQQLASLSALSASLAQQQAGEALVCFGVGAERRWLNARSIRMLSLARGMYAQPMYALMVDEIQVSEFQPQEVATAVLDQVAEALNQIMQPPQGNHAD